MKYFEIKPYGEVVRVRLEATRYLDSGALAVMMIRETGDIYGCLTVNLPESVDLHINEAFLDTSAGDWAAWFLRRNKLGRPAGQTAKRGSCEYPVYRFNLDEIPMIGGQVLEWISAVQAMPPPELVVMAKCIDTNEIFEHAAIFPGDHRLHVTEDLRTWHLPESAITHWRPYCGTTCAAISPVRPRETRSRL